MTINVTLTYDIGPEDKSVEVHRVSTGEDKFAEFVGKLEEPGDSLEAVMWEGVALEVTEVDRDDS